MAWTALRDMGRFEELNAKTSDPRWDPDIDHEVLLEMGLVEQAASAEWDHYAQLFCGRFEGPLTEPDGTPTRNLALLLLGRAAEIPAKFAARVGIQLALGHVEAAAALGETDPAHYAWPRYLLGLRAAIAGDRAAAERWFAIPPEIEHIQVEIELPRTLVVPFLRESLGDAGAFDRSLADTIAHHRWRGKQRSWHLARLVRGEIDDAAFLAQPFKLFVDADLLFARAIAADHAGRRAEAVAAYRAWIKLPNWRRAWTIDPVDEEFIAWRLAILADAR
jgi:hypothetical protein